MILRRYILILYSIISADTIKKYLHVFVLDVLSKGIPYLLLPVFTQIMSPNEFGLYTFLIVLSTSLQNILRLGADTAQSKLFYTYRNKGQLLFNLTFIVFGFIFILYLIVTVLNIDRFLVDKLFHQESINQGFIIPSVWLYIVFLLVYLFLNTYYQLSDRIIRFQRFNLVKSIVANIFIIIAILFVWDENNTAVKRLNTEAVIGLLISVPLILKYVGTFHFSFDIRIVKSIIKIGIPITLSALIALGLNIYDKYYLAQTYDFSLLAGYNLALLLCMPISLILSSTNSLWIPRFYKETNIEKQIIDTRKLITSLLVVYVIVFAIVFVALYSINKNGFLRIEYQPVFFIFPIAFIAYSLDSFTNILTNFLIQGGKTQYILYVSSSTLIIFIFLTRNLIPIYAEKGAIVSLTIISMIRFIIYLLFTKKIIHKALKS